VPYSKDPKGIARTTYRRPCPYCHQGIHEGEQVRKIGQRWWHEACRKAYRSTLGLRT
jgi:hypothetical protein